MNKTASKIKHLTGAHGSGGVESMTTTAESMALEQCLGADMLIQQ